jgi:hypothetical protein
MKINKIIVSSSGEDASEPIPLRRCLKSQFFGSLAIADPWVHNYLQRQKPSVRK